MATSWINTVWERERNTKWVRSISQLRNRANGWAKKRYNQQLCCLLICTHDINAHCRRCCRRHRCCCQHCPVNSLFIEMVFNEFVSFFGTISLRYADIHIKRYRFQIRLLFVGISMFFLYCWKTISNFAEIHWSTFVCVNQN